MNKKHIIFFLILIAIVTVTYANHFNNGFHYDDFHTINNNIYVTSIKNIPKYFVDGTTFSSLPSNQSYRPLVTTTLAIDYWLGDGLKPFYFHLSTFILFIIQGIFMFYLYMRLFDVEELKPWSFGLAAFGVSWYMLHPGNAETINYIIARSDTLSTLFVIIALVLFIYSPLCRRWHLYLIPVAIGTLAKPPAVMFAPILVAYVVFIEKQISLPDLIAGNTKQRQEMITQLKAAFKICLPAIIICMILAVFVRKMDPPTFTPGGTSSFNYFITQPYVILHYFLIFFAPIGLNADTDWVAFTTLSEPRVIIGFAFGLALLYVVYRTSKVAVLRPIAFGILWFLFALAPTSSVIPLAEILNYHRIFFPYVGLVVAVLVPVALFFNRKERQTNSKEAFSWVLVTATVLVIAGNAFGTYQRNKVWRDEESLWQEVVERSPKNGRGLMTYGLVKMGKGEYDEADKYFTKALEYAPYYPYLFINIGILRDAVNKPVEAEAAFKRAIELGNSYPNTYYFYGRFLNRHNRVGEAITNLKQVLKLAPSHLDANNLLMEIYRVQGEADLLRAQAEALLKEIPDNQTAQYYLQASKLIKPPLDVALEAVEKEKTSSNYLNLSLRYYQLHQYEKSIEAAQESLKLQPDYAPAYNNICAAYNDLKQWDKAIEAGEKAVSLDPNYQLAKNNLAWAKSQVKGK